ncbi:transmembrane protease serine 3-like [Physella acuta]|uniref:transmembrane protease serine 3-like n=1 Tax=Physella acuta TaxID=109671 RepID=UPI0027DDB9B3|nr:transmembrane protease serine 3-like [Physella acuta]XP_059142688.1 transmembrane protease serine 3-like [Physella acuta]
MFCNVKHTLKLLILLVPLSGDCVEVCTLEKQPTTYAQYQAWYQRISDATNYDFPKPDPMNEFEQSPLCGQTLVDQSQAIIMGEEAPANAWPWYVYLETKHGACGGSILTEWWILTAAHCVKDLNLTLVVYFGLAAVSQLKTALYIKAEKMFTESYAQGGRIHDDIMLVKLETPINFTDAIRPICLPDKDMSDSKTCFSIGYGMTKRGGGGSKKLMQIKTNPLNNKMCRFLLGQFAGLYNIEKLICVDEELGQGICLGDSGGPMVCKEREKYFIVGEFTLTFECGQAELPSAVTSVYAWLDWIKNTIKSNSFETF